MKIDWRRLIQDNFKIKTKDGSVVPFIFNDVQNEYYEYLIKKYGLELEGVRENTVKGRQQGFSSIIDGLHTAKFIMSNDIDSPTYSCQITSHKETETKPLFDRVDLFIDSYLSVNGLSRRSFLETDNKTSFFDTKKGSSMFVGTAGAKTLGRGGTLQGAHWSECAFYPDTAILNASQLVLGAEQQIADGVGMIFRESTGNRIGDIMYVEFFKGMRGEGSFGSVFVEWFRTKEYRKQVPPNYDFNNVPVLARVGYTYNQIKERFNLDDEQIYWWITKLQSAKEPKDALREYPMVAEDAFMASGEQYFDTVSLKKYLGEVKEPMKVGVIYDQIL